MKRLLAGLVLLVGVTIGGNWLFQSAALAQPDPNSPWPMFHNEPDRTGLSMFAGPAMPATAWTYETGFDVYSSPALGSNRRVYVGSWDHNIYAFNSVGAVRWTYVTGNRVWSSPAVGIGERVYVASWDGIDRKSVV